MPTQFLDTVAYARQCLDKQRELQCVLRNRLRVISRMLNLGEKLLKTLTQLSKYCRIIKVSIASKKRDRYHKYIFLIFINL